VNHDAAPGLYLSHPACLLHDPGVYSPGHPDTPERLRVLEAELAERDWLGWERREAPALEESRLTLVHDPAHIRRVKELCARGGGAIDPDTFVVERSFEAALHAAGGACEMARALLAGDAAVAYCAVRPSGHHAEAARAMGFCLFNNVAVAAAYAVAELGVERVLILDWDVHAGNGTAEIFRRRSDVLFVCIHEHGLYPGTGQLDDAGSDGGEGYTINLPVPARSGEGLWLALLRELVLPTAHAFAPDLILVSCGFDAHASDPLARVRLRTQSYAHMAALLTDAARELGAPLGLVQEGGYDSAVLAECVCAVLPALTGAAVAGDPEGPPADGDDADMLERARVELARRPQVRAEQR
jgi:acetoin utilization deacetylase AcuC-like enzyme